MNPSAIIWYWYVWKRWIFWLLFTPLFIGVCSFPFLIRSMLSPDRIMTFIGIMALFIFPVLFRLAAVIHIGRNGELDALRRNDWVICLAFPIAGFGVSTMYATRYMRIWALSSLVWWFATSIAVYLFISSIVKLIQ